MDVQAILQQPPSSVHILSASPCFGGIGDTNFGNNGKYVSFVFFYSFRANTALISPPCTYCRVLKVVEAVVGQDEPPSLPRLHPATCEGTARHVRFKPPELGCFGGGVEANPQKTPAPRATSGSDQQPSALLASITGCRNSLQQPLLVSRD